MNPMGRKGYKRGLFSILNLILEVINDPPNFDIIFHRNPVTL